MPHPPLDAGSAEQLLAGGDSLRRLARSLVGGDGDDVVQEGIAAALANPAAARERGPWLMGTVRRLAAMWRRSDRRRRGRELAVARDELDARSDPAVIAAQAELAEHVAAAVRALDEPFRSAIVLRYWRGLSPEQIASELGVPHNTVRSRLQRGLERLRAQLDVKYGERSRWHALIAAFAREEEVVVASAIGGGALLALGVAMNVKLILGAAVLVAAALTVPLLLDAPPAAARTESASTTPASAVVATAPAAVPNEREAAPLPVVPAAANAPSASPAEPATDTVAPWLARFRVIDDDDRPIDGATITIRGVPSNPAADVRSEREGREANPVAPGDGPLLGELRSDANGRASMTLAWQTVRATVSKDTVRSGDTQLSNVSNPGGETWIVLQAPVTLSGRVLRADGTAAAGANVTADVNGGGGLQRAAALRPAPVRADADGRFAFAITRHAGYRLRADLDGTRSFTLNLFAREKDPPEVVLTFRGAITLRGVVVDPEGTPVPGADVKAWREYRLGASDQDPDDYERAQARTDSDGRFTIDVQRHSRYQLVASAKDLAHSAATWAEPTAARPHAEVRLALQGFATIRGTVRHGDGTPFSGVRVSASLIDPNAGMLAMPSLKDLFPNGKPTSTDQDGRFTLQVHPGTHWQVRAFPLPEQRVFQFTIDDVAPGRGDVTFTIRDEQLHGCVVSGAVASAVDAQSVTGFEVTVHRFVDGKPRGQTNVDAKIDGNRFELPPLPLGNTYVLHVAPPFDKRSKVAWAPVRTAPFTTIATGVQIDVRVPAWGELPVRVLATDRSAVRSVSVTAVPVELSPAYYPAPQRPDADGRVTLRHCAPGTNRVFVTDGTSTLHEQEVLVTAGLNPELIVRMPAATSGSPR